MARSSEGSWSLAKASKSTEGTSGKEAELTDGRGTTGGQERASATTFRFDETDVTGEFGNERKVTCLAGRAVICVGGEGVCNWLMVCENDELPSFQKMLKMFD